MASTEETVLNYLREQNRPYSWNDLMQNLHQAVGKTTLLRDLDSLAARGAIVEKVYGKQKIYYFNQENLEDTTPDRLANIEGQRVHLESLYQDKRQKTRELQAQLDVLVKHLSAEVCSARIQEFVCKNEELHRQVQSLRAADSNYDGRLRRQELEQAKKRGETELKKRREVAKNIIDRILDGCYPGTRRQLIEDVGLEMEPPALPS